MAAQKVALNRASDVTLATTVKQISALNAQQTRAAKPKTLLLVSSDVDVIVVTAREATDGGAVPTSGAVTFDNAIFPLEYSVEGAEFLGLAAGSAGTVRIELR